jgi:phospholipid/cholesterol/gamma-HCH transport system substrate-binding protein
MKHRDDVLVGVVVTIAFIVLLLGSIWLVRGGLQSGYPLYARFPWGSGIKQGQ